MSAAATSRLVRTNRERARSIAEALKCLADERGIPNAFTSAEVGERIGLTARQIGFICNDPFSGSILQNECAGLGIHFSYGGRVRGLSAIAVALAQA